MSEGFIEFIGAIAAIIGVIFTLRKMTKDGPTSTRRWHEKKRRY